MQSNSFEASDILRHDESQNSKILSFWNLTHSSATSSQVSTQSYQFPQTESEPESNGHVQVANNTNKKYPISLSDSSVYVQEASNSNSNSISFQSSGSPASGEQTNPYQLIIVKPQNQQSNLHQNSQTSQFKHLEPSMISLVSRNKASIEQYNSQSYGMAQGSSLLTFSKQSDQPVQAICRERYPEMQKEQETSQLMEPILSVSPVAPRKEQQKSQGTSKIEQCLKEFVLGSKDPPIYLFESLRQSRNISTQQPKTTSAISTSRNIPQFEVFSEDSYSSNSQKSFREQLRDSELTSEALFESLQNDSSVQESPKPKDEGSVAQFDVSTQSFISQCLQNNIQAAFNKNLPFLNKPKPIQFKTVEEIKFEAYNEYMLMSGKSLGASFGFQSQPRVSDLPADFATSQVRTASKNLEIFQREAVLDESDCFADMTLRASTDPDAAQRRPIVNFTAKYLKDKPIWPSAVRQDQQQRVQQVFIHKTKSPKMSKQLSLIDLVKQKRH